MNTKIKQIIVLGLIALSACTTVPKPNVPEPTPTPTATATPNPSPAASPTPGASDSFTFECVVCNEAQKKSVEHARQIIFAVRDSKCFEDFMLKQSLVQTNDLTNAQVIAYIRNWKKSKPIPIEFYTVPWYKTGKNVIGYGYEGDDTIYLNATYRATYAWSDFAEASNEFHEVSHKMGFEHDFENTARRPNSVPYMLNRAVEYCTKGDVLPK